MSFPHPISAMKLNVSTGTSPNVETFEQDILPSELSGTTTNSVIITNSDLLNAFSSRPLGTIFNPSVVATYEHPLYPSGNEVSNPSASNYVPKKITPSLSLADILDKLTTDASFSVASLVSKEGTGVLSYSSNNTSVATVNSSTGQVTIVGAGTTSITVSLAASVNQVYTAATPVSKTLKINKATPTLSLSSYTLNKLTTDVPFLLSDAITITKTGTGVLSYSISSGNIASINSSTGEITINGAGTISINVTLQASSDGVWESLNASLSLEIIEGTRWIQRGEDINGKNIDDNFGYSVSISSDGSTIASSSYGYASVYKWDTTITPAAWVKKGLDIPIETQYGYQVFVSLNSNGSIIAVGSSIASKTILYEFNTTISPNDWVQRGSVIEGLTLADWSGYCVSLSASGNVVAIGDIYYDGSDASENPIEDSGRTRIFDWNTNITPNDWTQRGGDILGYQSGGNWGESISLSADGNKVAIGASWTYDINGSPVLYGSGAVGVYYWNTNNNEWTQYGGIIYGEYGSDLSGRSVSLSEDALGNPIVAIGATGNDPGGENYTGFFGHVRVYKYDANKTTAQTNQLLPNTTTINPNFGPVGWNRLGADIDGEAEYDRSGRSVSLSADGTIVAIGSSNSLNGKGSVRIFEWNNSTSTWTQKGLTLSGSFSGDNFGYSVSISGLGDIVVVGAIGSNSTGKTIVYKYVI